MSAARSHRTGPKPPSLKVNLAVLVALLLLLGVTVGSALIDLGPFNPVANLGIAIVKAVLVMTFFMRLNTDSPLLRIVAVAGFAWLVVLIALTLSDILTRPH
jgi:cytochrome c oxidase subunit 4